MKIRVTTRRSNAIVRKGETVEVEWTPRIGQLIDAGRLTDLTPPAGGGEPSKEDLLARADAAGVHVAKSWTKDRIAHAIAEGSDSG